MSKPTLAYWDIRGLAEPIRLMLKYLAVDFEDKRYVSGDAPDYSRADWTGVKPNLGLEFPNLPYYIDGDIKMTESFAIMKYIARKNGGLLPTDTKEWAKADMVQGVVTDFRSSFTRFCYSPDYERLRVVFYEELPDKLDLFDRYLNGNKWLAGDKLTFVDFALAEILDHIRINEPGCLDKHANVKNFVENFFKLEKIDAYRTSSEFKRFPINNKVAKWGGNN